MGLGVFYDLFKCFFFLIIPNQVSSIMHFNNWRLSPIPSPSQLPPTQKVPVASLLCRYGADSVVYGSLAGPYRLIYQKAKTITENPEPRISTTRADPEGVRTPLKNHKNMGFLDKTGSRFPEKSLSFQVSIQSWAIIGPSAKRHLNGPLLVLFGSFFPSSKINK